MKSFAYPHARIAFTVMTAAIALGACSGSRAKPEIIAAPATQWTGAVETDSASRYHPVIGTRGMVVADDREAAAWGAEIMRRGGNAVDAAVATAFAMAVTRPHYAALGGGGFMVYCPNKKPCQIMDYREMAPSKATRDMYIRDGKPRTDLSQDGALASGVPGVTMGLLTALKEWGTKPREEILKRPIDLARRGYVFSERQESAALSRWKAFNPEAKKIFGCKGTDGELTPCPVGSIVKQPDLARTLTAISDEGAKGFYEGPVAKRLAAGIQAAGGIITEQDLAAYRARPRDPIVGSYKGMQIVTMPPPSAGGALIVQMLGYMERAGDIGTYGSVRALHAMSHAMSLAFADRATHFGDPDVVPVPVGRLTSAPYLDARWKTFKPSKANPPESAGDVTNEGMHTTHFSVIDREGNAVAVTTTVNDYYGSGFVPPGTGVVMNNEMDDFSIQPGVPNLFGLVGLEANAVGPRKRPLSSMSPTIVRTAEGEARIVIGAAGGPTITTSVFGAILNRLHFGMSIVDAVAVPRLHHQWKPNEIRLERNGFSPEVLSELRSMGYSIKEANAIAKVHALERFSNGRVWGAPDFRGEGAAVAE